MFFFVPLYNTVGASGAEIAATHKAQMVPRRLVCWVAKTAHCCRLVRSTQKGTVVNSVLPGGSLFKIECHNWKGGPLFIRVPYAKLLTGGRHCKQYNASPGGLLFSLSTI